jgi:hypothetical protein
MCEPRRLTTLWASTAFYRDSFTFFTLESLNKNKAITELEDGWTERIRNRVMWVYRISASA